jgi:hypothetical protein
MCIVLLHIGIEEMPFFFSCKKPLDLMDSARKGPLAYAFNSENLNKLLLSFVISKFQ